MPLAAWITLAHLPSRPLPFPHLIAPPPACPTTSLFRFPLISFLPATPADGHWAGTRVQLPRVQVRDLHAQHPVPGEDGSAASLGSRCEACSCRPHHRPWQLQQPSPGVRCIPHQWWRASVSLVCPAFAACHGFCCDCVGRAHPHAPPLLRFQSACMMASCVVQPVRQRRQSNGS